jgi:site-specific DNA recombinase
VWALLDERGDYRLRLESASEPFETSSPMGRAMIGMLAIFAQLEADMCSERTSAALEARRARGHKLGAKPLVEERPEDVARIRALYASGAFTYATLAEELNTRGVLTKRGKRWHATTVARTLRQGVAA